MAARDCDGRLTVNPIARIILIVVYSILGLAAAGRATVQILEKFSEAPVAYAVSALALAATIGWTFLDHQARRRELAELEAQGVRRRSERAER